MAPVLVCVKNAKGDGWALKALSKVKLGGMLLAGSAVYPGTSGLSEFCLAEETRNLRGEGGRRRRDQEQGVCVRSDTGFVLQDTNAMLAPVKEEETVFNAPKKE